MSLPLQALREQLAAVVAGTPSEHPGLPTGLKGLDLALPGGGLPRGRITELLAPAGLGKTTLARAVAATTLLGGHAVAWIDATRTLDPRDFIDVDAAGHDALWIVRPGDPARAAWCADLLLRTGAFALVVLDGAPVLARNIAVRLAQLARDGDTALLLLGEGSKASEIGGALRLVLKRRPARDTRGGPQVAAWIEKGGPQQHIPLHLEVGNAHDLARDIARRLCAHPEVPDRRGVARARNGATRIGSVRGRRAAQPSYPKR
jgi:recombination protein RecA